MIVEQFSSIASHLLSKATAFREMPSPTRASNSIRYYFVGSISPRNSSAALASLCSTTLRIWVMALNFMALEQRFSSRLRLVELGQLLFRFGGPVRPGCGFVEFDKALKGFLQAPIANGGSSFLPLLQTLVTGEQQRLGFRIFLLPQQAAARHAPAAERPPMVRNFQGRGR